MKHKYIERATEDSDWTSIQIEDPVFLDTEVGLDPVDYDPGELTAYDEDNSLAKLGDFWPEQNRESNPLWFLHPLEERNYYRKGGSKYENSLDRHSLYHS